MTEALPPNSGRGMFMLPAGIALLFVGLAAMLIGIERYGERRASSMQSWPSTMGTITGSGRQEQRQSDGYWNQYDVTGIRYSVDGHTYSFTSSVYAGHSLSSQGNATATGPGAHANEPVRVFYDPANPSKGALTLDPPPPSMLVRLLAGLMAALSLPFWYMSGRMLWTSRRPTAGAPS